jgi:hypothetical protein
MFRRKEVVKVVWHGDTSYSEFSELSAKMKAHELVFIPKTEVEYEIFSSKTIEQQHFFSICLQIDSNSKQGFVTHLCH